MWAVSDQFLEALKAPHKIVTTLTVTVPGGTPVEVGIKSGSLQVDAGSRIRRRGSLVLRGDSSVYELVATPGAILNIQHGLIMGNVTETVPAFQGEVTQPAQSFGDGEISVQIGDNAVWLSRTKFVAPYAPTVATQRVTAIANVVTTARPGTTVINESSDTGTIGSAQVWQNGPLDVIADLTRDGNTEAYFRADGTFVIRDQKTTLSPAVWTINSGSGGTLTAAERTRDATQMYNTVCVDPSATDGSQTWARQTATVTDPNHPRYPAKIGIAPYYWSSPTAKTAGAALSAANSILDRVLGTTETLALGSIANPALEANDVIRVITPPINTEPAQVFQHFIDSMSIDLASGSMTLATRSQAITDD